MHRSLVLAVALSFSLPVAAHAQAAPPAAKPANDSLFRRARKLVSEGNGAAGRTLVDSLLAATPSGSADYGNALYWHGALAQTAAEAEHDYRRVIVEYPLAYYADDALLAMAELEQARGDRASAMQHLQRFVREHPASSARGIAALGAARLAFEQRDTKTGCAMIGEARASAGAGDVELVNQISYYASRCPNLPTMAAVATTPATAAAPVTPAAPAEETAPVAEVTPPVAAAPAAVVAPTVGVSATKAKPSAARGKVGAPKVVPAKVSPKVAVPKKVAHKRVAPARAASVAKHDAAHVRYTIQLAAFNTRAEADRFIAKLRTKQLHARVSGNAKPFRVRLGYFGTRDEAASEVSALKTRGIIGFAVEEP